MDDKLESKVSIDFSLRNIPRHRHGLTAFRAILFVDLLDSRSPERQCLGHTENEPITSSSGNGSDADFNQQFVVDYYFEEYQVINVSVYHCAKDKDINDFSRPPEQDLTGRCSFTMGDLLTSPARHIKRDIENGGRPVKNSTGDTFRVIARFEKVSSTLDNVTFDISSHDLESYGCCASLNPYLELFRERDDHTWQRVHQTEAVRRTDNPLWKTFTIAQHLLCSNDVNRLLRFSVLNLKRSGGSVLIGYCETTLAELLRITRASGRLNTLDEENAVDGMPTNSVALHNPSSKRKGRGRYQNAGVLTFHKVFTFKDPSFLDYLMSGLNVRLIVAIDFTASNGDPAVPDSLHYIDTNNDSLNPYESAIADIGNILATYDSDQMFPVWGFGAKLRSTNKVSHLFSVTFDENIPEVKGINGIIKAYRRAFPKIQLSGPTMFNELIGKAAELASLPYTEDMHHYYILLIITDGVVNDRSITISKIIEASDKPLSIIIIGVGTADFSDMHLLDSDDKLLEQDGKVAKRDIVQFVELKGIKRSATGRLASEVLAEVPDQVVSFMKLNGITPKPQTSVKRTNESESGLKLSTGSLKDLRTTKLQSNTSASSDPVESSSPGPSSKWTRVRQSARVAPTNLIRLEEE